MEMEASIPFLDWLSLGCSLDVTKKHFKRGPLLVPEDVKSSDFPANITSPQFSIISSINDVCDIFQVPVAYALKVQAGLKDDKVISSCLNDIDNENVISTIFRISFLQQKQYLPSDIELNHDAIHQSSDKPPATSEDTTQQSTSDETAFHATHWVKALELGNELIVICKIATPERDELSSTFRKLTESVGSYRGLLDSKRIASLEEFAKKMDKKMKKKHYSHIKLNIEYCTHSTLQYCPANLTEMVNVIKEFITKCEAWTDIYRQAKPHIFNKGPMTWKKGTDMPQEKGALEKLKSYFGNNNGQEDTPSYFYSPNTSSEIDTGEGNSFQVIAAESDCVYFLRAIVQSFENEDMEVSSFNMVQYPETIQNKLYNLHKLHMSNMKATEKLLAFLGTRRFISENNSKDGNELLKKLNVSQMELMDMIKRLDFVTVPTDEELNHLLDSSTSPLIDQYIETVTSKLPPGHDLDLLLIGKTGHGKSSTGNSILGQTKFKASGDGESVTSSCGVGWSLIDGRTIKVIDTPGVCDTRVDSDQSSIDVAIHAISEAIAQCPNGFHALLLVIRYGQRMTTDERKAIGMLKCILGDDIIKAHCVCVITHGDNFITDTNGEIAFEEWCKSQTGFLREIFEECQHRCVLFNNKSNDSKVLKNQIIELVARIDGFQSGGTRYTNSLFEFAMNERKRAMEEEKAPELDENVMRDIHLILDHLDKMVKGTNEVKTFEADLDNLRYTIENLKNQVNNIEGDRMAVLVDTVFSLAQAVHTKMDQETNLPPSDSPEVADPENVNLETKPEDQAPKQSCDNINTEDLKVHQEKLQEFQKGSSPKSDAVAEEVTKKVEAEVKKKENCFPATSWVIVKDGSFKTMKDLKVGDEILVRNGDGKLVFETVYMFGHQDVKAVAEFLVLKTEHSQLIVSYDHMVYCHRNGCEVCVPARSVKESDRIIILSGNNLVTQSVIQISCEEHQGLYAPFTKSGTLIVDGTLLSCYIDVMSPEKAHKLLRPVCKLYELCPPALKFINGSERGNVMPPWARLYLNWRK